MFSSSNCSMGTSIDGVSSTTCTRFTSADGRVAVFRASLRLAAIEMPPFTT